jgi:PAS domain S-box-containing protein
LQSEISHVTERFHRVQSVSRSFEGTGIGLALCAELVQVLGGRLEIESSTAAESPTGESGSTFSVFLKYGRGHLPEGMVDESDGADTGAFVCSAYSKGLMEEAGRWTTATGSSGGGSIRTGGSTGGRSTTTQSDSGVSTSDSSKVDITTLFWDKSNVILLVDDSADMLQYLYGVLSAHCQVLTAVDGNAALKILEKQRVDLVVSDIQMPTLDGYGLLAGIRAHKDPDRAITPVILISARAGEEERVGALLASADDVLPKPFSAKELIARAHLQVQLGKRRLELERNFRYETATTKLLSDLSPVGISRWRTDGTFVYANQSWYDQSGHPRDKPLSEWMDSIHPDHKGTLTQMYADLFEGRQQVKGEWLWTSGRWSYCQAVIVSSHENDNYNGTICVLTDITERKRYDAERKLAVEVEEAHLRQRAESAEERKREADEQKRHQEFLVSVVSHEVCPIELQRLRGPSRSRSQLTPHPPSRWSSEGSKPRLGHPAVRRPLSGQPGVLQDGAARRAHELDALPADVRARQSARGGHRGARQCHRDGPPDRAHRQRLFVARQDPACDARHFCDAMRPLGRGQEAARRLCERGQAQRHPHLARPPWPAGRARRPPRFPYRPRPARPGRHQPAVERDPLHQRVREARDHGRARSLGLAAGRRLVPPPAVVGRLPAGTGRLHLWCVASLRGVPLP